MVGEKESEENKTNALSSPLSLSFIRQKTPHRQTNIRRGIRNDRQRTVETQRERERAAEGRND
jgi:hypothetical protein